MPRQNHHDFHLWHASDLWKSTAAINTSNHSPRMQPSNDCSTSSGLEIQKRDGWEPDWTPPIMKYALARITNVLGNFGLYSPSWFKIQHTIAVYARWVPRFRHLRNPHETCTQTDWTLWHENFDQHQIARISQCSTGLQVQKCTQMNISGYRPWQYHTQTLKGESVARKTGKDQKLLAERHLSSCWASSSQQIMLKQNIAQLRLCFVKNYWTKTLHGLCCAHLRSGRDLSQLRRERSASAKLPAAVPPLSWWSSIVVAKPCDAHRIKQSSQKNGTVFSCFFKASTRSSIAVKSLPVFSVFTP